MTVKDNLLKILKERGLSMSELARKSGVSQPRISEIVLGKTKNPRVNTLALLAKALGVTVDEISTGRGKQEDWEAETAQTGRHPAVMVLEQYIDQMAKTNPIRAADFLSELKEAMPEIDEWVKKMAGKDHPAEISQQNYT